MPNLPHRATIVFACLALICGGACSLLSDVQAVKVEGSAMLPTLKDGDRLLIDKKVDKLEHGDIVIFHFPDDPRMSYIKRIVALPNDVIEINEGNVIINGTPLHEPYVDPKLNLARRSLKKMTLPPESYFVIGDNRDNSSDSRIWGALHRKFIYGKYVKKYFATGTYLGRQYPPQSSNFSFIDTGAVAVER